MYMHPVTSTDHEVNGNGKFGVTRCLAYNSMHFQQAFPIYKLPYFKEIY